MLLEPEVPGRRAATDRDQDELGLQRRLGGKVHPDVLVDGQSEWFALAGSDEA